MVSKYLNISLTNVWRILLEDIVNCLLCEFRKSLRSQNSEQTLTDVAFADELSSLRINFPKEALAIYSARRVHISSYIETVFGLSGLEVLTWQNFRYGRQLNEIYQFWKECASKHYSKSEYFRIHLAGIGIAVAASDGDASTWESLECCDAKLVKVNISSPNSFFYEWDWKVYKTVIPSWVW